LQNASVFFGYGGWLGGVPVYFAGRLLVLVAGTHTIRHETFRGVVHFSSGHSNKNCATAFDWKGNPS
jgi:hypothetical protein